MEKKQIESRLSDKEKTLLTLEFLEGSNTTELQNKYGITRTAVGYVLAEKFYQLVESGLIKASDIVRLGESGGE